MFFKYNLPGIIWALLILVLCGLPGQDFPDLSFWKLLSFDKAAHAFVFAVLVLLLIIGFKKQYSFRNLRHHAIKIATTFSILYGGLIELLQGWVFIGRSADPFDFLANTIGCFTGLLLFYMIYGKQAS